MLILAKAAMAMMLGFILSLIAGFIILPILKKKNIGQYVSETINERHLKKAGTPTMGGFIFIIPVVLALLLLYFRKSVSISYNLIILIFVFLAYGAIGGLDDYLKIKYKNNKGLSIVTKFLLEMIKKI